MLGCVMVKSLLWLSSTAPFPASITACSPGGHPGVHVYMTAAKNHMGRKVCWKIYIKMNKLSLLKYLDHCIFHVYMCVPVTSVISQLKLDGVRQHTNRYSWFLWRYLLSNKKKERMRTRRWNKLQKWDKLHELVSDAKSKKGTKPSVG